MNLNQEIRIIETPFEQKNHDADFNLANEITAKTNNNYLLFYGTIGALKGAKEIADSVYSILSKYQNLYLVLIGKQIPIEGELPIEIIHKSAKEFANRVIWYDRQPHEKLFPIIKNSLAVLLPSRVDNLPNTCIEAMNLKKIVIGSNGASFEQLIKDGENGFLCEANNAQSIVNAVDKLMSVSNERKSDMEQKAYERTLLLAPENIVPQVIDYYDYVIKNWRAA